MTDYRSRIPMDVVGVTFTQRQRIRLHKPAADIAIALSHVDIVAQVAL